MNKLCSSCLGWKQDRDEVETAVLAVYSGGGLEERKFGRGHIWGDNGDVQDLFSTVDEGKGKRPFG